MRKILYLIGAIVFFSGCESGNSLPNENLKSASNRIIELQKNKKYEVNKGDKIKKESNDTEIRVESDFNNKKTYIMLMKGNAKLIKSSQY